MISSPHPVQICSVPASSSRLLLAAALGSLLTVIAPLSAAPDTTGQDTAISFDQLGAEAGKQYTGDGISITPTSDGAKLRAILQDLEAEATSDGLWLHSTAEADLATPHQFRIRAAAIGRGDDTAATVRLPDRGKVRATGAAAVWVRPGLVEEYSVSADGVRQDFVVPDRMAGAGPLVVTLDVTGARAEQASYGAKLTVAATGRELAYHRLKVTDAAGSELTARMEVGRDETISLRVDDAHAVYPIRIDPTFSDDDWVSLNPSLPGANSNVYALLADGGGNLYVGGQFTAIGTVFANRIAKWDGSAWAALGPGVDGWVNALALDGSGNLYAGGSFTTAGGVSADRVAKWDGSVWSALGSGMDSYVSALALDGSGNLYAGGAFTMAGGVSANRIAKWDGSAWSVLGSGMSSYVRALTLDGSDNLYAGGDFTTAGGVTVNYIAMWNGSAWSQLGSGMDDDVDALVLDGSGNLYAGGAFTMAGGVSANHIAKWDGSAWSPLGSGMSPANSTVWALVVDGSGNLYAGGYFTTAGGVSASRIAKWDGSAWSALGSGMSTTGGSSNVRALALDGGGNLYAGGSFDKAGGVSANDLHIARWDTSAWSALGSGMDAAVLALALDGSGNLYAGGEFITAGGVVVNHIAKWDGSAWSALGSGMSYTVRALVVDGSGNLYAGGNFWTAGGVSANRVAKWNGSAWSPLGSGMDSAVWALAVDGTGSLYAGGFFTTAGGESAQFIAKWDGSAWSALGSGTYSEVYALGVDESGNVYAGGAFTSAGGVSAGRVAKWDGSAWSALGSGMDNTVRALSLDGSGDLYAGGSFTTAGGVSANCIAKWDGSTWSALGSGMSSSVYSLAVDGSDNLYAGGYFTTAGGVSANRIAKWDGSAWSALGSGMDGGVRALAVDGSGRLYAGGYFFAAGPRFSPFIVQGNLLGSVPEIAVEQPAETDLADGGPPVNFGSVVSGSSGSLEFTIRNSGDADLTGLGITIDGANWGDFVVTANPTAPVVPGGDTTFTVTFTPGGIGSRSAQLHIASNDADENPFNITLTGTGVTAEDLFDDAMLAAGLTEEDTDLLATPNDDGVSNLLKYAFNMNLAGPDTHSMAAGGTSGMPGGELVEDGGQTYWRVEFVQRIGSGLIYTPKKSTTLLPGSFVPLTASPSVTGIDDQWQRVTYDEPCDPATTPACFSYVEVSLP